MTKDDIAQSLLQPGETVLWTQIIKAPRADQAPLQTKPVNKTLRRIIRIISVFCSTLSVYFTLWGLADDLQIDLVIAGAVFAGLTLLTQLISRSAYGQNCKNLLRVPFFKMA